MVNGYTAFPEIPDIVYTTICIYSIHLHIAIMKFFLLVVRVSQYLHTVKHSKFKFKISSFFRFSVFYFFVLPFRLKYKMSKYQ